MSKGAPVLATSTLIVRPRQFFQINILSNGDGGGGVDLREEGGKAPQEGKEQGRRSREACHRCLTAPQAEYSLEDWEVECLEQDEEGKVLICDNGTVGTN